MARRRQREIALAVVAVLLIGAATWRIRSADRLPAADPAGRAPAATARPQLRDKNPMPEVDLQALQADRPEPDASTRNPFRFRAKPAPPPPPPPTPAQMKPQIGQGPVATGPVEPPPPPRIPLKFIGLMTSAQDRRAGPVAILSDTHGVYYGREGEIVEGRYRILKIGVESIELAYLDGRGRQTIRQTGQ